MRIDESGQPLSEDAPRTAPVEAEETANPQVDCHGPSGPGLIGDGPPIAAVDALGPALAERTLRPLVGRGGAEEDAMIGDGDAFNFNAFEVWKKRGNTHRTTVYLYPLKKSGGAGILRPLSRGLTERAYAG